LQKNKHFIHCSTDNGENKKNGKRIQNSEVKKLSKEQKKEK